MEKMRSKDEPLWTQGTVGLLTARARGDYDRKFQNRLTVTKSIIDRLGLEKELHGHMGCVNCLEWNTTGSILASASDDLHVILWDPFRYKLLQNIPTGHTGNIFSVKFISEDTIATCAADGAVRVRNVNEGSSLLECTCHCGRVKRLACAPDRPEVMWSAGEDGLVLQHDLRTPHTCNSDTANVVVNLLNNIGKYAEAKCVAVNPRRPYQLAVGANDCYVRLYDTRMIKLGKLQDAQVNSNTAARMMWERQNVNRVSRSWLGDPDRNIPLQAVTYFAPGHLSIQTREVTFPKKATTYVSFSNDGNELLVNLGSEQVYLFDINLGKRPVLLESFIIQHNHRYHKDDKDCSGELDCSITDEDGDTDLEHKHQETNGANGSDQLPERVRIIKETANRHMNQGNYPAAVEHYNLAIADCPHCALLYSNRAAALVRRGWAGDTYAAVRDCYSAIRLQPAHVKAHFRLAKALMDLKKPRESQECLLYFKDKFPKHAESHAVFLLQKDINTALESLNHQSSSEAMVDEEGQSGSAQERQLRSSAVDYKERFLGHCNTTTDIKEATFLGPDASFIAAGSDDGNMFIWSRASNNIARCLRGDESIVNCVQLHPAGLLLATSGIEAVVRLWSARPSDPGDPGDPRDSGGPRNPPDPRLLEGSTAAVANQQRMRSDPFEAMLLNISFAGAERDMHPPACRTS